MKTVRVGIIGYGFWGKNVARNLADTPGVEIVAAAEPDKELEAAAMRRFCHAYLYDSGQRMMKDADLALDAVAITTPVSTHYDLGMKALEAGFHVLMAKPLAASPSEAEELTMVATDLKRTLITDHTFLWCPPVAELLRLRGDSLSGDVWHISSQRTNLGLVRNDVDVIWDLAVHDLSIIHRLLVPETITHIACVGADPAGIGKACVANLTCWSDGRVAATIEVSWLSPVKVRRMVVTGSKATVIWDDTDASEPIKVYDRGLIVDPEDARIAYRTGEVVSPRIPRDEALAIECEEFVRACRGRWQASRIGVQVVNLLAAASASMLNGGEKTPV